MHGGRNHGFDKDNNIQDAPRLSTQAHGWKGLEGEVLGIFEPRSRGGGLNFELRCKALQGSAIQSIQPLTVFSTRKSDIGRVDPRVWAGCVNNTLEGSTLYRRTTGHIRLQAPACSWLRAPRRPRVSGDCIESSLAPVGPLPASVRQVQPGLGLSYSVRWVGSGRNWGRVHGEFTSCLSMNSNVRPKWAAPCARRFSQETNTGLTIWNHSEIRNVTRKFSVSELDLIS